MSKLVYQNELELESLAAKLISKYPDGYLAGIEVGWPCRLALRAPVAGLDSPRCILTGSYQELRAFENVYTRMRMREKMAMAMAKAPSSMLIDAYAFETMPGEIAYWQRKDAEIMLPQEA